MASQRLIGEVMTDAFAIVSQIEETAGKLAVLVDDQGEVAGLIGPSGAGPAYTVTADMPVQGVTQSPELLSALVDGAPGLVVVAEGRPVAIVGAQVIQQEILRLTETTNSRQLGGTDHTTHGDPSSPAPKVRIGCKVCRRTNVFDRYSRAKKYRCQHGNHDFVPFWAP